MKAISSLVMAHPSGDPEPSEEDLRITKRLIDAGKIVGIELLRTMRDDDMGHSIM